MNARFSIVQTDNGSFPPVFDRESGKRLGCRLRLVRVRTPGETLSACRGAHLVLATRGVFDRDVIAGMRECLAIIRFGVGVENIDVEAATKAGIAVAHAADFCCAEVADTVAAAVLALNRRLVRMSASVKEGAWDRRLARPIHRLENQVLGLVGFGAISRAVAARMRGFGLHVAAFDPYVPRGEFVRCRVEQTDLGYLLRRSDFVSLHVPLTQETFHLIGAKELAGMKPGAYLINTSRGKVVDEAALYRALKERRIAGAALDVLEEEPPRANPVVALDNVIVTPHYASYSEESFDELVKKVKEGAIAVLKGRFPEHMVNPVVRHTARLLALQ